MNNDPPNPNPPTGSHLLACDDDPVLRRLIQEALSQWGPMVDVCDDERAVPERMNSGEYSVLVLDLQMRHRTGVEIIRDLRIRGCRVPVILMSSMLDEDVRSACSELGGVRCLPKPFSIRELAHLVDDIQAAEGKTGEADSHP